MSLGNSLFNARKKAVYRKKKLLKNWVSADRQFQSGSLTKRSRTYGNLKSYLIYII